VCTERIVLLSRRVGIPVDGRHAVQRGVGIPVDGKHAVQRGIRAVTQHVL
jgi:hypothetical protein